MNMKRSTALRVVLALFLSQQPETMSLLFDLALEVPENFEVIKVASTMRFRGARPETREEWLTKLEQIKELIGDVGG